MRRLFSLTLLLLLTLPLLASFAGRDAESRLPACCRRGGAHHCMLGMESSSGPAVRQRCDSFPQATALVSHVQDWGVDVSGLRLNEIVPQGSLIASLEAHAQGAFSGSLRTRGPPSFPMLHFGAICLIAVYCLARLQGSEARELTITS